MIDIKIIQSCWLTPVIHSIRVAFHVCGSLGGFGTHVVKHGFHVSSMQERNSHFYSISWCQKWHVFRKTSKKCTRNSSSKNCGNFHFRDFQFSIFDLLDSITAIFKSQISRFSRKTYFLAPKWGVDWYTGLTYSQVNTVSAQFLWWIAWHLEMPTKVASFSSKYAAFNFWWAILK